MRRWLTLSEERLKLTETAQYCTNGLETQHAAYLFSSCTLADLHEVALVITVLLCVNCHETAVGSRIGPDDIEARAINAALCYGPADVCQTLVSLKYH